MTTSLGGFGSAVPKPTGSANPFKGTGYKQINTQQYTPEQMQLFQHLLGMTGPQSSLSKLAAGDQSQFEQLEAPALQQFQGIQGQLASRFSGMGGLGARNTSGFQNTMNQVSSDFAQKLQSDRLGLQRQATMDLSQISQMLLGQRPYEENFFEEEQPWWKELLLGAAPAFGTAIGTAVGGPIGGAAGGAIGSWAKSKWGGKP